MTISDDLIEKAIDIIADIQGIEMNHEELVDDVILIANEFDDEPLFKLAIAQIEHSLNQIVEKRNLGQKLVNNYDGWLSYHFQSQRKNGQRADLRIVYQDIISAIRVRGFGHRHSPLDVYQRLNGR